MLNKKKRRRRVRFTFRRPRPEQPAPHRPAAEEAEAGRPYSGEDAVDTYCNLALADPRFDTLHIFH